MHAGGLRSDQRYGGSGSFLAIASATHDPSSMAAAVIGDGGVESPALVYADLLPVNVAKFVPASIVTVHLTIIAPNKMMVTR